MIKFLDAGDDIHSVGLPDGKIHEAIFKVHLHKRKFKPEKYGLVKLARASDGFTGSEIEQAVVSALHESLVTGAKMGAAFVRKAVESTRPLSVTMSEYVTRICQWARDRCVPVD